MIETKVVIGWFLNCNFERDWLIEPSDNKLSTNNLASELEENRSFLNQSQLRKLYLLTNNQIILAFWLVINYDLSDG